jgi:mono/diheme cytochrome c family protein
MGRSFHQRAVDLIPAALFILARVGFSKLNARFNNPVEDVQVAGTPDQIARGERLANLCVSCHTSGNQLPLSGSNFAVKFEFPPLGTLYAPNLTPSGNIKDWTDREVIRAIREGVHKNGRSLLVMPSATMRNMSDEDVQALVAYLRSQLATGQPTPDVQFNVLAWLNISNKPGSMRYNQDASTPGSNKGTDNAFPLLQAFFTRLLYNR